MSSAETAPGVKMKDKSGKKERKEKKDKRDKDAGPSNAAASAAAPTSETTEPEAGPSKKRNRPEIPEEDLQEIDMSAPEPLSKAEARAAKKRAKLGKPELDASELKKELKRKRDKQGSKKDNQDDLMGDEVQKVQSAAEAPAQGANAESKKAEKPKRQNSIWIGNLSFRTAPEGIKAFFDKGLVESGGKAGSVTRINLPKKADKGTFSQNKGYAYVDFDTPEMQALAIGLSERLLDGRKVLIKRGDDYNANPDARTPKPLAVKPGSASILAKQPNKESATLFMGNLPFDATEAAIRDMLEANAEDGPRKSEANAETGDDDDKDEEKEEDEADAGHQKKDGDKAEPAAPKWRDLDAGREGKKSGLRKVRLGQFEDSGRCKGFGFLDFLTPRHATVALSNRKNHYFSGRKLVLQYASESATRRSGAKTDDADGERPPPRVGGKPRPAGQEGAEGGRPTKRFKDVEYTSGVANGEAQAAAEVEDGDSHVEQRRGKKPDQRGKKWEATGRPRPGAALAMAKREKVGIVEAQGAKIVFD